MSETTELADLPIGCRDLILSSSTWDSLKKACVEGPDEPGAPDPITGLRVFVEPDAFQRKLRAFGISMFSGRQVMFEDEPGTLVLADCQKPKRLLDRLEHRKEHGLQ